MRACVVALCGAGDRPIARLGGRTPLEAARLPALDRLAAAGRLGLVDVIGEEIAPESDSGAMALLGYDPLRHYTGRGALEGLGLGLLDPEDREHTCVCFRINFACYDEAGRRLDRRTARDLSLPEQAALVEELRSGVSLDGVGFRLEGFGKHRGVLCFTSSGAPLSAHVTNTDPGFRQVGAFGVYNERFAPQPLPCAALDDGPAAAFTAEVVNRFLAEASSRMRESPVNAERARRGRLPANVLLLRDPGDTPPDLPAFAERFGLSLAMYGQIPSEQGLCRLLGGRWTQSSPPADGLPDHYRALAAALLADPADVVFVHVKGPDEPAHDGLVEDKIEALELIDRHLLGPLAGGLGEAGVLVVTSDHRTPCELRVHSADPVPLLLHGAGIPPDGTRRFSETEAAAGGLGLARACELMERVRAALRLRDRG